MYLRYACPGTHVLRQSGSALELSSQLPQLHFLIYVLDSQPATANLGDKATKCTNLGHDGDRSSRCLLGDANPSDGQCAATLE